MIEFEVPVVLTRLLRMTMSQCSAQVRGVSRGILGPVRVDGEWPMKYNSELYLLYDEPKAAFHIKIQKFLWAGDVECMNDRRIPRRLLRVKLGSKRLPGKPLNRTTQVTRCSVPEIRGEEYKERLPKTNDPHRTVAP